MSDTRPESSPKRGRKDPVAEPADAVEAGDRIAKVMARAGLCSRRDAEAWIKEGRVAVNGKVISSPALNVGPDDAIAVDGQAVSARERTRLFLYHKPRGLVTTARDPEGRATVFESLPDDLPRVVSIGRLDINTEGLLLLTNDGGLARVMELPATGWLRRYRVRANGFVTQEKLDALRNGITIDGIDYAGIEAALDRTQGANQWLTMGLREGKNREIKRVLEHLGLAVNRLIRLSFGPFQLGDLAEGAVEEVRTRVLKDQLGEALAAEAGVMWEDAVEAEIVTRHVAQTSADRGGAKRQDRDGGEGRASASRDRAPRGRDAQAFRAEPDGMERPRQDRPAPKSRPHVSALRGDETKATGNDGPRKRISRATTEDRRGRSVKVERVTVASRDRVKSGEGGTSRNARNFARDRREAEFGDAAVTPRRTAAPYQSAAPRQRDGERTGGFSSERPLTGRAMKDGKVRSAPGRTSEGTGAPRGRASGFGEDAAAPRRSSRQQDGERAGGFSSERPLTGRAMKDGKVRSAPGRTAESKAAPRGRASGFGDDAAAPRRSSRQGAPSRQQDGERTGGFSSERPLTGRALKDGKVRSGPSRTGEGKGASRNRSASDAPAQKRNGGAPRDAAPRSGNRPQGSDRPKGGNRPQGGDRPRGGGAGGSRPPRSRG